MKLPGIPGQLRGGPARSGRAGAFRGTYSSGGIEVGGRRRSRFTQISATFAVAALVLMGSAPAMAEGEPSDPPPLTAPVETTPPVEAPPVETAPPVVETPPADVPPAETPAADVPLAPQTPPADVTGDEAAAPEPSVENAETPAEQTAETAAEEEPEPPYLRWRVTDDVDELVGSVTLEVQGPRDDAVADDGDDGQWAGALAANVVDNMGQPDYAGADLDPKPGEFLVKQLVHNLDATRTHDVSAAETYRMRPSDAPKGFASGDASEWLELASSESVESPVATLVLAKEQPVSVMRVLPAPKGGAVINVTLRALRGNGAGTTAPTAGIQLQLHTDISVGGGNTFGTAVGAGSWGTCTTDAAGDCSFQIPATNVGGNVRYWVVPTSTAGSGSFLSDYLVTGNNTDSGSERFAVTPYAFRTPAIPASNTPVQIPASANMPTQSRVGNPTLPLGLTTETTNRWAHSSDMVTTLANQRHQATCTPGLKVALIIDLSTSMVSPNQTGLDGAKLASKEFAAAFANKGVNLGIYSFGTNSNPVVRAPSAVTSGNLGGINTTINNLSVSGTQYTNWDRGIAQIAGQGFDMAVMLTDGNPTRWGNGSGSSSWTDLRGLEEAMLSANGVKSEGTQMMTFGVGAFLNGSMPQNLRAVTGPIQWTAGGGTPIGMADFAVTSDWAQVATQLGALASGLTCEATVQVQKQERAAGGGLSNAAGWTFTPTKGGLGTLTPNGPQTTNASGALPQPWKVAFSQVSQQASLQIAESAKVNWEFESVQCTNHGADMGIVSAATFTLPTISVGDNIVCKVINKVNSTKLTLAKTLSNTHGGTSVIADWTLTATGPITVTGKTGASQVTQALVTAGSYTLSESGPAGYLAEAWLCVNGTTSLPVVAGVVSIPVGGNVTCAVNNKDKPATIVWNKASEAPNSALLGGSKWTITGPGYLAPGTEFADCVLLPCTGTLDKDPVAGQFTLQDVAWGSYTVTETLAPPGYSGSASFTFTVDNSTAGTTIAKGPFINKRLLGGVKWAKVAEGTSNLLSGSEWKIVGTSPAVAQIDFVDCVAAPCLGPDKDPLAGQFELNNLAWSTYTVTETKAPPGYIGGASFTFVVNAANAGTAYLHGNVSNEQQVGVALPLTGGMSGQMFTLAGSGIALLSALLGLAYWRRFRRSVEVS